MQIPFYEDIGDANEIFDNFQLDRTFQVTSKGKFGKLKSKTVLTDKKLKNKVTFTKQIEKLGNVEVVTNGSDLSVEVTNKNLMDKMEISGLGSSTGKNEATLKYNSEFFSGMCATKLDMKGDTSATISGVVGIDGVSVGIEAALSPSDELNNDYNAAIDWQVDKDTTYSLKTSNRCDEITASFWHRFAPKGEIATRMNYNFGVKSRSVDVAASYGYGQGTFRAMLASSGVASFLYKKPLSTNVKMQCAVDYKLSGGDMSTSWKLEFDA